MHGPFTVSTDGSNDDHKLYPIVVRYFNCEVGRISTSIVLFILPCLHMLQKVQEDSSGSNIANLVITELHVAKMSIPWENCMAFSTDNACSSHGWSSVEVCKQTEETSFRI